MVDAERVVLDASVAAKWYLRDEQLVLEADDIRQRWVSGDLGFLVPSNFVFEVANAVFRAARRGRMTAVIRDEVLLSFASLVRDSTKAIPGEDLVEDAAQLASELGVAFFDACYLVCARRAGLRLITADAAFYRQVGSASDVLWLGDYNP